AKPVVWPPTTSTLPVLGPTVSSAAPKDWRPACMSLAVPVKTPLLQVSEVWALLVTEPPASSTVPSLSAMATCRLRPLTVVGVVAQTFLLKTASVPEGALVAEAGPPVGSYNSLVVLDVPPARRIFPAFGP